MSDSITIPGTETKVKNVYVYVGAAVVAGIVTVAWYRRKKSIDAITYIPDTTTGSNTGDDSYTNPDPHYYDDDRDIDDAPTTDQEWSTQVIENMSWYEPGFLSTILGKYLSHVALSSNEVNVIREAWAIVGKPPSNTNIVTGENKEPQPDNPIGEFQVAKTWWDLDQWITWLKSMGYDTSYEKLVAANPSLKNNVDKENRFINAAVYNVGGKTDVQRDAIIVNGEAIAKVWWDLDQWLTRLNELGYHDVLSANPGILDDVDQYNRFTVNRTYNLGPKSEK